jgi:hypothetical protein
MSGVSQQPHSPTERHEERVAGKAGDSPTEGTGALSGCVGLAARLSPSHGPCEGTVPVLPQFPFSAHAPIISLG